MTKVEGLSERLSLITDFARFFAEFACYDVWLLCGARRAKPFMNFVVEFMKMLADRFIAITSTNS